MRSAFPPYSSFLPRRITVSKLIDDQHPVDLKIANELVAATPEHWNSAMLELTRSVDGKDERVYLSIRNEERLRELVTPTDDLYALSAELAGVFRKHGANWRKIIYRASLQADGSWKWRAGYEYF